MAKQWKPKRVRDESERGSSSAGYIQLDEGQKFLGHALFEGNPADDEPGYYEYMEHWNQAAKKSIPCAGEDCPLCEDGDKPKTRAKSLWFVLKDEKGNEVNELRTFNLNFFLIKQFTEMRGEGEKIKGRLFRVSRLDDRGAYSLMPKDAKLTATEVKEHLKSKDAPDYDAAVTNQLKKAMEGLAIARALDDDDDDDEPAEEKKSSKGKGKSSAKDEKKKSKKNEWPSEGEDIEVTVDEVDEENFVLVSSDDYDGQAKVWGTPKLDWTDVEDGATVTVSWVTDDDDDLVATEYEVVEGEGDDDDDDEKDTKGDDDDDGDGDLPDTIEDAIFEVVSVDPGDSTIEVKSEELELEFTLYFLDSGPASKVDFDDYEEGAKIKLTAEKDSVGDMVATAVPEIQKAKAAAKGGKSAAKKGGKKGGKGK